MSGFEDFLSQETTPVDQTAAPAPALPTPAAPPGPPSDFASFLAKAKGEDDTSTMQAAKATTVANVHSGVTAATAGQAAQTGRQLGIPQAAVETDPQTFQAQAKAQANTQVLSANPILAKWVAANPASARIAQDEYDKLGAVEKMWDESKNAGYSVIQALGGSYNSAALNMNRLLAPNALVPWLFKSDAAQEWWQQNMIAPAEQAQATLDQKAPGIGAAIGRFAGSTAGMFSQVGVSGGMGAAGAVEAGAGVLTTIANAAQNAVRAMWLPAATASVQTGHDVMGATGDTASAIKAAAGSYLLNTLQGAVPFSAPGNLVQRAATGFVSGMATSEGQRAAMNLLLPGSMEKPFDLQEMLVGGVQSALMGALMGPRSEPNAAEMIRQTYTDALKAEMAQRDIAKVAALGQIAGESELRKSDPDAFHDFVTQVTDKSDLDAVWVNGQKLGEAFAQSGIDAPADIKRQIGEAVATGGDVRIAIADYATHIAGTDVEKAILPDMKAAADGMTYSEGQKFYQDAAKNLTERAKQMADERQANQDLQTDKQGVQDELYQRMVDAGREPGAAKTEAALAAEFYATMAQREGMKPSEFAAEHPVNFASAGGGFEQPLYLQSNESDARGAFNPTTKTVSILKNADLSTVVHELGHSFLDTLSHVAVAEKASEGVKTDFGTMLKWFGVKDAEAWHSMSLEEQRPFHEKFAKAFEQYMFEGKAPNPQLQTIFGRIRSWMLNVYKHVANIGAELNPEVRQVFDRMLASEEAIKQAETLRSYAPLFENAKAMGKDADAFNAYQELGKEATERSVSDMQARSLKDMKWASNTKNKALRGLQRQADAARKDVRAGVEQEVGERPEFQAKAYLSSHKNYDPDIVAGMFGFEDADAMNHAIEKAGDRKAVIDQITDQRMLQQHGELIDPQSVEDAANAAVHNEARARFIATGLQALTKSPLPANQIAKAAKEVAEKTIAAKAAGDLRPDQYLAAEARANKEALAKVAKDPAAAIEAQRSALLNNRLAKAAMDAKDEIQKGLTYFKKFDKATTAKGVGADYMDRINEMLSAYDVTNRFTSASDVEARVKMRDWLQSEYEKNGVMPEVSDALMDFANKRSWKELSVEEFRGLVDSVKSLEHVGREATSVMVNGQRVELQDMVDRAKANMAELEHAEPVDLQPHLLHATGLDKISTKFLSAKSKVRGIDAALLKMEQLFQWLDRGKQAGLGSIKKGPFLEMFQRASEAEGQERAMRADSAKDMRDLGKTLRDAKVNLNESLTLPLMRKGRGNQWYREELLAAALNTGNAGNLKKLVDGYGWNEQQLRDVLNKNLSGAEWKFVQGVWDAVGKYGDPIKELQRRQTGVTPEMVEPVSFTNEHGTFKGGYYPVVYDAFQDHSIDTKQARQADMLFENQWNRPTTSKGHTIARTGYVGPVQLSLGVIGRHLDQVTHDLAWREPIVDMNKFLSHPEIRNEVDQTMGREYRKQFRPWLQAMANDKVFNTAGDSAWEKFYRTVRANTTMVGLGFRLSTMEIHGLSALSNSIGEVGTKWFAKGAAQFATPDRWAAAKQFMFDRSPEMANRFNESDRNIHEAIDAINEHQKALGPISATQKAVDAARRFAFYGVSALDMGSAAPTWYGAYLKGMAKESDGGHGLSEDDAIDLANRAVRNAHGGGGVKDLSAVQRDKGAMSMATMFYSFWNHMYNRQRDLAKGYANLPTSFQQGTGTKDFAKLLARSWYYFVIPQMIHAALKPSPQDQEEGLEGTLKHMAEEVGLGFVSGVPVLRDLANAVVNGRDYTITPIEQAGKSIVKATVDTYKLATGEETKHAGKNIAQAVGYAAGLPTGQLSGSGAFLWDVYNGDADPQGIKDWYTGLANGKISP